MARWWRTKKEPSGPTAPRLLDRQLERLAAVAEGRANSLDLQTFLEFAAVTDRLDGVRMLAGLRHIRRFSVGRSPVELPSWLSDLPNLETVDLRGRAVTSVVEHERVRWAFDVDAQPLAEVEPQRIFAVGIGDNSSVAALTRLIRLSRSGRLDLSELLIHNSGTFPGGPSTQEAHWRSRDWLARNIDEILASNSRIRKLGITGYPFGHVPAAIAQLTMLSDLRLTAISPKSLPDWLFELPSLKVLGLDANELVHLPESVGLAQKLWFLSLSGNKFSHIPDPIWKLSALRNLTMLGCPIRTIPREILHLKQLQTLNLGSRLRAEVRPRYVPDELTVPPPEVVRQGLAAIKSYWLQEEEAGVDYLAEAKLLIVGEAGAGKTSLSKKILDPSYRLDASEESTEGIDVRPWIFPSAIRIRDDDGERMLQRDFRVNVWDFGGQEIYHSTHQFFLTKRSVYVLVCDERKEDTDFQYWLDVVNLLSGGSPMLIVQNRKQGRAQALNMAGLRQAYPQLCGTVSLNLADNDGLDEAVAKIRKEVESLPHIGTSLPKTWRDVRVALEGDTRDHISAGEFFRICRDNGFTRDSDIRQLGGFLHDLGICLFFQDDTLLRKTVILKPDWGTGAVYRVLDDDEVIAKLGVFDEGDLPRIWHEPTFAGMHAELVQLMVKFALCFAVEGEPRKYVAPQLLSPEQPDHDWDDSDNLVLRYEYEVMPKGIVRRLIVAMHDLIEGAFVWRTGVVLNHESARAEIIENYHRRRLRIRLSGNDPRVLLAMIDRELTLIHRSYSEIRFDKLRPCNCAVCAESAEPAMFLISELEDFARTGHEIQCRVSRELLDPVPLLAELSPDRVWRTSVDRSPPTVVPEPEVFVSYRWGGEAEKVVDEIEMRLGELGMSLVRDKTEMSYRDSIRDFMRRLGAGKAVIVVLDQAYLQSDNCMFELTEIAARPEFRERVFPLVLADAGIFRPLDRLGHIGHWERKRAELENAMRGVSLDNLQGIREELDLYEKIRSTIAGILDILGDMNTLTPDMHRGDDFQKLYQAIVERLERDQRMAKLA